MRSGISSPMLVSYSVCRGMWCMMGDRDWSKTKTLIVRRHGAVMRLVTASCLTHSHVLWFDTCILRWEKSDEAHKQLPDGICPSLAQSWGSPFFDCPGFKIKGLRHSVGTTRTWNGQFRRRDSWFMYLFVPWPMHVMHVCPNFFKTVLLRHISITMQAPTQLLQWCLQLSVSSMPSPTMTSLDTLNYPGAQFYTFVGTWLHKSADFSTQKQ